MSPDEIIQTIAMGFGNSLGDGGPATQAQFLAENIALGPDGSLYLADRQYHRIRRITPDGIINTVAGGGSPSDGVGDGGSATQAKLTIPRDVAVAPDGALYIADVGRVRYVGPDGIISTVAGGGSAEPFFDYSSLEGQFATRLRILNEFSRVAIGPDGKVYLATTGQSSQIVELSSLLPSFTVGEVVIPSEDGSELYRFDNQFRHIETRDAVTSVVLYQFVYDANGYLAEIRDREGDVTRFMRAANGDVERIISPNGVVTAITLNNNGYTTSLTHPDGGEALFTYTVGGLLTSYRDPRGNSSIMTYDVFGRLAKDQDAAGGSWTLTRTENQTSHTSSITSALGRTTNYRVEYLPTGDKRWVNTGPDGTNIVTLFGSDGSETTTAPDGTVTTQTLTPDGRFAMQSPLKSTSVKTPSGMTLTITNSRGVSLSNPNDLFSVDTHEQLSNINGKLWQLLYTASTKQYVHTSPTGRQITSTADDLGRIIDLQPDGLAAQLFAYDSRGRLASSTQGSGADQRVTMLSYNSRGFLDSMTDAVGRNQFYSYDLAGRVTQQTLPDGRVIQFAYDPNGNVTSITPPSKLSHGFTYTPVDLEAQYTPPAAGIATPATQYVYNLDKQLTKITRPDGQTVDFGYDTGGRLGTITVPNGTLSYAYHATTGNLQTLTATDGGSLNYVFDGSLLKQETWSGAVNGAVTRTYNNDFRVTGLTVNGADIAFTYDNDGLLTQAGSETLARDPQHGLITGTTLGSVTTTQAYNPFGEMAQFTASQSGSPVLDVQYTRDKLGRITQKTETLIGETPASYAYTYDTAGRLIEVQKDNIVQSSYAYDPNGNRLSKTTSAGTTSATTDDQDRLLTYGNNTYTYTANGELKTKTNGTQTTSYTYDVLGNLTNATLPNGTTIEYLIDGRNRRVGKKVNGTVTQGFLYQDQLKPIAELDGLGNVVARFVYGDNINVPEYLIKGTTTYRILTDHLGSPRLVVNTSTGNVEQRLDYDEFGNVTTDTNPGFQPFGFAGGIYDKDTKLTRFGARDYDPETGRWTAKDPIWFEGGDANLYAYVYNNPLRYTDPTGEALGPIARGVLFLLRIYSGKMGPVPLKNPPRQPPAIERPVERPTKQSLPPGGKDPRMIFPPLSDEPEEDDEEDFESCPL